MTSRIFETWKRGSTPAKNTGRWIQLLFLLFCAAGIAHAQRQDPAEIAPGVLRIGSLEHFALVESSGLTVSRHHPGVFWTHNDTEDPQFLFAITREGAHLGAYQVQGANLIDWEAVATDEAGWLYFADTGIDGMVRSHSAIHRVEEPSLENAWGPARVVETWFVRFPGAREDCEGLFIVDGWAYLVSKTPVNGRVTLYRFSLGDESESILLQTVASIPVDGAVSDVDLSPDGMRLALVTDEGVTVLFVNGNLAGAGRAPRRRVRYESSQMEGGAFVDDGVLVTSEGITDVLLFTGPFLAGAPVFTTTPEDEHAFVGDTVELSGTAAGFPAAAYQWFFNGQPIPGETSSTLVLTDVSLRNAGVYELVATNPQGTVRAGAVLTVTQPTVDVRITEVMSSEVPVIPQTEDWWELTSFDTRTNDLSGWRFNDSTGDLTDAFVLPEGLLIRPGESIVFVENLTADQFRAWWGETNFTPDIQIVTFSGAELSFNSLADSVRLWDREATNVNDLAAQVEFGAAETGVSFTYDPVTSEFGRKSQEGVGGAFRAASGGDVGSPGRTNALALGLTLQAALAGEMIEIRFSGEPGLGYILEVTDHLESGIWLPTGEIFQSTNVTSRTLETSQPGERRFYRLRRE